MAMNAKLAQLSKMWKKVQPIAPSTNQVPDGEYVAKLKEIKLGESKNGRFQAVSAYVIADGEFEGQTVKKFDGLDTDANVGHFKHYTQVLGVDLSENAETWQEELDTHIETDETLWNVALKTNGQYQNVYNNGPSELTVGAEEGVETVETSEEEAEEVEEVVVEEEEEEEEQQIVLPAKNKMITAKPVAKLAMKQVAKPVAVKKVVVRR